MENLAFVSFPEIARLARECVVTEELDGTNAQVFIFESELPVLAALWQRDGIAILAGSRTHYIGPESDNHGFARWVQEHAEELAQLGPGRHFGEWWGQGINRGYGLKEKRFSLFNVRKWGDDAVRPACCHVVPVLGRGEFSLALVETCLEGLYRRGSCAAPGFMDPEGVVVFHTASSTLWKKTLKNDDKPKVEVA